MNAQNVNRSNWNVNRSYHPPTPKDPPLPKCGHRDHRKRDAVMTDPFLGCAECRMWYLRLLALPPLKLSVALDSLMGARAGALRVSLIDRLADQIVTKNGRALHGGTEFVRQFIGANLIPA